MPTQRICYALMIIVLTSTAHSADAATTGYWRFEEASGPAVDSADDRDGTFMGNASRSNDVFGPLVPQTGDANTQSASFTGTDGDGVDMGVNADVPSTTDFTVELFTKVNTDGAITFPVLAGKVIGGNFNDRGWALGARADSSVGGEATPGFWKPQFEAKDGFANDYQVVLGPDLAFETWYHLAGVRDGTVLRLYVDGIEVGNVDAGAVEDYSNPLQKFVVGGAQQSPGSLVRPLDGFVDEVRLSDVALEPSQFLMTVPEPTSLVLLSSCGMLLMARRRRSA